MTKHFLWQKAAAFAARAHHGQLRKGRECTPYMSHPFRVAMTVACTFGFTDDEILAAALLHDVIEDTDADYDDILEQFGKTVADYVAAMTKDMRLIEFEREPAYDKQLANGPWQARLIKLADVFDNLSEAHDKASKLKLIVKAERVLALAQQDSQLASASSDVRRLTQSVREGMK